MEDAIQLWKTRISVTEIQKEEEILKATRNVIEKSWNAEVKCYENGSRQNADPNRQQLDPRIFPYHKSCYLLLDMYLCVEGEFPYKVPFYVEEFARRNDPVVLEEGYLPNSAYAVWASLVPIYRTEEYYLKFVAGVNELEEKLLGGEKNRKNTIWISSSNNTLASDFSYLSSWSEELSKETKCWFTCDRYGEVDELQENEKNIMILNINDKDFRDHYFQGLPSIGSLPKGMRTKVLLKLLKHSMSEIQRDHRLSRAVLLAMVDYKCLDGNDGAEAFRYFLLTIESEFIYDCDEDCQNRADESDHDDESSSDVRVGHVCSDVSRFQCSSFYLYYLDVAKLINIPNIIIGIPDPIQYKWRKFVHTLSRVFQWGIRTFTEQHALILCSFFRSVLDSAGWKEVEDLQTLIGWNDDDYTMAKETPLDLIRAILDGLSRLNYQFRCRVTHLLRLKYANETVNEKVKDDLYTVVKSHIHCTRALVSIAEIVLKSCNATPVTESIGSILATGLTLASIFPLKDDYWYLENAIEGTYIGSMDGSGRSLLDVTRYTDCVTHASCLKEARKMMFKRQFGIHENQNIEEDIVVSNLFLTPLDSIQNVERGLYLRQLVESNEAGCGYGDFVVWSGGNITPFEPLLFEHNMNYPNRTGYDENILKDERGQDLNVEQIKAMYDLSLLMLRKAWTLPWTPTSHESFSTPFKRAIKTIALIAHRHNFPLELCIQINSYISRDWWPSEGAKCWRYECQIGQLERYLNNEIVEDENENTKPLVRCNGCRIAHACGKKHLKEIFHDGHRRLCRCPPYRVPTAEDDEFCLQYLRMEAESATSLHQSQRDFLVENLHEARVEYENMNNENTNGEDNVQQGEGNEDDVDDDDEWESVGSEGDSTTFTSRIDMVVKYFENKAYKIQRVEDHAFANFYME